MKLVHLSDLHLGKRVNGFSMLEDQKYILAEIIRILDEEKPDAVLIAGDVYDKSVPSGEAVQLLDSFLCRLAKRKLQVFITSGNHDSAERLSFASNLIDLSGIHLAPVYDGKIAPFALEDAFGTLNVYMLPFIKPLHVRTVFGEEGPESYTEALGFAISKMNVNPQQRNVLVAHQFVTGALRSESEEISVGGTDNVDASVFDVFDYVALGHIHAPQHVGKQTLRYCGTPLKYSFSEMKHQKSVTVVELGEKGAVEIRTVPLVPKRDMREVRGKFAELIRKESYENTNTDDYMRVVLTDEQDVPDVMNKLRTVYPNLMEVRYDNVRTRSEASLQNPDDIKRKSEPELFAELFEAQNGQPLSEKQQKIVADIFEALKEGTR